MRDLIISAIFNKYIRMECRPSQMVMLQTLWLTCSEISERNEFNQVFEELLNDGYLYLDEQKPYCVFLSQLGYDTYVV